tara:strand:- start:418 stop:984 length:567 start_codon:yes stop_codon:yes gene_type:complete
MCNPYAYAAMQFGSAYVQYKNDKAQAKNINDTTFATAKRINNEAIYTDISLQKKKSVEFDKSAGEKFKLMLEAKQKTGSAKVQLFERGIQGNSFDYLINDVKRNEGRAFGVVDTNYENVIISIEDSRLAYNRQFTNQILSLPLAAKPNFGMYAIGAAANSSMAFMNASAPATPDATATNSSINWQSPK